MNLGKKYKQLFEGKTRSNDSKLLKENVNPESDEEFIARLKAKAAAREKKNKQNKFDRRRDIATRSTFCRRTRSIAFTYWSREIHNRALGHGI